MDELLIMAKACLEHAEAYLSESLMVTNEKRRVTILAIAEHFYALHGKFMELSEPASPGEVIQLRRDFGPQQ